MPPGCWLPGGVIWATNVIAFGLWYWDLGSRRRRRPGAQSAGEPGVHLPGDVAHPVRAASWVPKFADYLSLGFWTATAFSPTDISAVRPWAKLLMITEAAVSLGIAGLVIARAINILA